MPSAKWKNCRTRRLDLQALPDPRGWATSEASCIPNNNTTLPWHSPYVTTEPEMSTIWRIKPLQSLQINQTLRMTCVRSTLTYWKVILSIYFALWKEPWDTSTYPAPPDPVALGVLAGYYLYVLATVWLVPHASIPLFMRSQDPLSTLQILPLQTVLSTIVQSYICTHHPHYLEICLSSWV